VKPRALARAAALADVILFDVKLMDEARHRRATRVSNRMILDNLRALAAVRRDVIVRVALVPGVNDDWHNLAETAAFVRAVGLSRVDLLPYHRAGAAKYPRLGRAYTMDDVEPPSPEAIQNAVRTLSRAGLDVRVGGSS
jgi:pyruvate formate lyase activating enzyme